jgi:hypothetical protein
VFGERRDCGGGGRAKRILLVAAIIPLVGCPYEAAVEPVAPVLPLRSALVGTWSCGTDDEPDWALTLGWSEDRYLLVLRPLRPHKPDAEDSPWVLSARPRQVGGHEVWSLREDKPQAKLSFVRVEVSTPHLLKLGSLGDGKDLGGQQLAEASGEEVTKTLADTKETIVEKQVVCRR